MILSIEQIISATEGFVKYYINDGYIRFSRFTEKQEKRYAESEYNPRNFASSGMKITFKTNSLNLRIKGKMTPGGSRTYFSQDVVADGKLVGFLQGRLKGDIYEYDETYTLPAGEKKVCIFMPPLVCSHIAEIELDDGSTFTPVRHTKTLITYGDSITQGYDCVHPQNRYGVALSELFDAEEICKAIGGEKFCPWLVEEKEDLDPDYITVAYGTNHWAKPGMTRELTYERSREFYTSIRKHYPNARIFAFMPIWRNDYKEKPNFKEFSDIAATIKESIEGLENITVIEGIDIVPHDIKYYSADCVHPNDAGHIEFSKSVIRKFKEII